MTFRMNILGKTVDNCPTTIQLHFVDNFLKGQLWITVVSLLIIF